MLTTMARRLGIRTTGPAERRLLTTVAIDATGGGLFLAGATLFYSRVAGLSAGQIGIGLSVLGIVALAATLPNGLLVDRIGPRHALIVLHVWRGVWCCALAFVHSFWQFLAVLVLLGLAEHAGMPALQAYVGSAFGDTERVGVMARVQVLKNTGFLVGALLAAVAVGSGTDAGYRMLLLGDGLSFFVAAVLMTTVRNVGGRRRRGERHSPLAPLKNLKFLVLTCCNGVLQLNLSVLVIGMPLWVTRATEAPEAVAPLLIAVNTVIAISLQVPLSRGAETVPGAGRHMRRAGLSFALMCGTLIVASWTPSALAATLMVASVVLHTLGEIWHSSGGWGLQFALSPEAERGNYAAAYSLGPTAEGMVGPSLIAGGVVAAGSAGWTALALLFLAAGLGAHAVARRAVPVPSAPVSPSADRRAESSGKDGDLAIPH
ncbi:MULTISPECIES: MFS transporter [Streptomyces]|uniref:MFS transporter n=1 Tax=Streptomyces eurythermus TaxID=42237 RepID=A0ABW6Z0V4_9ACTN|nr:MULTISPECIES: MFS transporter [Streptomyces]QIS73259.1 MFS transporter [Streptomyces sp. DSM 40868]